MNTTIENNKIPIYNSILLESGICIPCKPSLFFDETKIKYKLKNESNPFLEDFLLKKKNNEQIINILSKNNITNNNIENTYTIIKKNLSEFKLKKINNNKEYNIIINWSNDNELFKLVPFINLPYHNIIQKTIDYNLNNPDERVIEGNKLIYKKNKYKIFRLDIAEYINKYNLSSKITKLIHYHMIPTNTKIYMIKHIIELISKNIYIVNKDNNLNNKSCQNINKSNCLDNNCEYNSIYFDDNQKDIIYYLDNVLNNLYDNNLDIDSQWDLSTKLNLSNHCLNIISQEYLNEFIEQISQEIVQLPLLSKELLENTIRSEDNIYFRTKNINEALLINPTSKDLEKKLNEKISQNYFYPFITLNLSYKTNILKTNDEENYNDIKLIPLIKCNKYYIEKVNIIKTNHKEILPYINTYDNISLTLPNKSKINEIEDPHLEEYLIKVNKSYLYHKINTTIKILKTKYILKI